MAEKSSFFNAVYSGGVYDREYLAEDFAAYFASFIGNGVFALPSDSLQITASSGMNVTVKAGSAWINGYYYINNSNKSLSLDIPSGSGNRIDRIVVRWDLNNRNITTVVKKGSTSVNPTPPTLTRTSTTYELSLANIYIPSSAASVIQGNITDERFNKSVCGIVSGVVDLIDTTDLFAQYDSAWNTWFNGTREQLDHDVAGHLQNEINSLSNVTTATIQTGWTSSSGHYYKDVTLSGFTTTTNCIVGLNISSSTTAANVKAINKAYGLIYAAENMSNKIRFYATAQPSVAIPIIIRGK